ncbi:hypothetical protein [Nannocystis punicea]|uniref:Uncharacterized protein n=1 Tax=Nannocystis punicea TaxID=2995304 RepID=A0ABY7GVR2_9BACT|nr:hypothetical protein [Nannocystis poenicansa]WAS91064.1 hypothetical protein O0S08_33160 [Nannocystis poenicansa]
MAHPLFDDPRYRMDIQEGLHLYEQLCIHYPGAQDIRIVYACCGADLPGLKDDAPRPMWDVALGHIARALRLRRLCEHLLTRTMPKLVEAVRLVMGMRDIVERTVLGADELPFLDRKELRGYLEALARETSPLKVVVVRGERFSGRTWTRHLVESVADSRKELVAYYGRGNLFDLDTLVSDLFATFKADRPPQFTTNAAGYNNLCTKLAAAARDRDTRCWLIVDDLDADQNRNSHIDSAILAFFDQFVAAMANPVVRSWFRLVLIAYPVEQPTPTRWEPEHFRIDEPRIDTPDRSHVLEHLEAWAASKGRALLAEEREAMGHRIMQAVDRANRPDRLSTLRKTIATETAQLEGAP